MKNQFFRDITRTVLNVKKDYILHTSKLKKKTREYKEKLEIDIILCYFSESMSNYANVK